MEALPPGHYETAESLRSGAALLAYRLRQMQGVIPDNRYCSVAELVAEEGLVFRQHDWVPGAQFMRSGKCFADAASLAEWSRGQYLYVEGFAGKYGYHHAWCMRIDDGAIIDPTWGPQDGVPYLGVILPRIGRSPLELMECYYRLDDLPFHTDRFTPLTIAALTLRRRPGGGRFEPLYGRWLRRRHLNTHLYGKD